VKLTTHLHLVPRSKNQWSYTSNRRSWRGALLEHKDIFTFNRFGIGFFILVATVG
jgi:hypothetical protein